MFAAVRKAPVLLLLVLLVVGVVVVAGASQSPGGKPMIDVKLGLWETTTAGESQGVPPIDTSSMTPEQKARLEAFLQAQKARGNTPTTRTSKSCLTKEKLEKGFLDDPARQAQVQCKQTVVSNSATELHMKADCTGGGRGMSGDFHFVALSRESVRGEMTMVMGEGGRGMTVKSTMTSKWLGAECGDLK
jgi:hypothetical protein